MDVDAPLASTCVDFRCWPEKKTLDTFYVLYFNHHTFTITNSPCRPLKAASMYCFLPVLLTCGCIKNFFFFFFKILRFWGTFGTIGHEKCCRCRQLHFSWSTSTSRKVQCGQWSTSTAVFFSVAAGSPFHHDRNLRVH